MNKPLVLPANEFVGANPSPVPPFDTPAAFTMAAKSWKGVPIRASDSQSVPVAWTLDQLAITAYDYTIASFPTTDAWVAVINVFEPTSRWGTKGTLLYKPRNVFLGLLTPSLADAATFLASISAGIVKDKLLVNVLGSAFSFASATVRPLAQISLPASSFSIATDAGTDLPGGDSNFAVTMPSNWTAGETLHFCWLQVLSNGAAPTGHGPNQLAADAARINGDFAQYDKFGVHVITVFNQSAVPADDPAWLTYTNDYLNAIMAGISSVSPSKTIIYQYPNGGSVNDLLPTIYAAEIVPKIVAFFGL